MKIAGNLVALAMIGALNTALAHDFWVDGNNEDKFKAHIGFGHGFPMPEAIPEDRMKLFDTPYIVKKDGGKIALKQAGENYQFEGEKLGSGSYVLAGDYKPTFISVDKDNKRHMGGTKESVKDVQTCRLVALSSKEIISVGGAKDEFVTKPIGQKVEIVPLKDPSEFKAGEPFKVQVFADGKPLKRAKIMGTFDGFLKSGYAFYSVTDLEGTAEVMALKEGKWMLKVSHDQPYKDEKVCDKEVLAATLVFDVKK